MCLDNAGGIDLEPRKIYALLPDAKAAADGLVRVVDDSGEDYLYPAKCFVPVTLPAQAAKEFG